MRNFDPIVINKNAFRIYVFVTLLILILMKFNFVTYGQDATDAFMSIIFFSIGLIVFILRKLVLKSNNSSKSIILSLITVFMILMIIYYFVENNFRIQ